MTKREIVEKLGSIGDAFGRHDWQQGMTLLADLLAELRAEVAAEDISNEAANESEGGMPGRL
jgi:hypothetical protein